MYTRRIYWCAFQAIFRVYLVIVFLNDRKLVHGVDYGPSLTSLTGVYVNWKGPSLFALDSGKKINLAQFPNYAVVIPLTTGSSSASSQQIFQERVISTVGEFTVEAPPGYGVMAVIQELSLRKSKRVRARKSKCSDYVQFGELGLDSPGAVTGPICGDIKRGDPALNPRGLLGPRVFHSGTGRMKVIFNHAYVSELVDTLLANYESYDPRRNPILKFEVAFTAFNDECPDGIVSSSNATTTEIPIEEYDKRSCSNYNFQSNTTNAWNKTCISAKLFCDDIQNCGGDTNALLGSDESYANCPQKPSTTTTTTDKPTEAPSIESLEDDIADNSNPDGSSTQKSNANKALDSLYYFNNNDRTPTFRPWRTTTTTTTTTTTVAPTNKNSSSSPSNVDSNSLLQTATHKPVEFDFGENPPSFFNKADITNAISSVIYGVAIFIIFTVFITVCFICVSKKIQKTLNDRNSPAVPTTPSITPATTTTVITHNTTNGINSSELAFAPPNTTVVLLTLPQNVENCDPPPDYYTLFPSRTSQPQRECVE